MSSPKILVSGCGISYHDYDQCWVWTKLVRAAGANVTSLAAPAVSNSYILTGVINEVLCNQYDVVICQLSGLGKLDVYVADQEKYAELVEKDTTRNFTVTAQGKIRKDKKGIWPSSYSTEHPAKKLWASKLHDDAYECFTIGVMVNALYALCKHRNIKLVVIQGYEIDWRVTNNIDPSFKLTCPIDSAIINSWYETWCIENQLTREEVPGQEFQFILAEYLMTKLGLSTVSDKLKKIKYTVMGNTK